jgi:putative membrane protein
MLDSERYQKFIKEELILRDQLAIDRTKLSNDRTLLSFSRTALTLLISGITALHFISAQDFLLTTLAWLFTLGGPVVMFVGLKRYQRMLHDITNEEDRLASKKKMFSFSMPHLPRFHKKEKNSE